MPATSTVPAPTLASTLAAALAAAIPAEQPAAEHRRRWSSRRAGLHLSPVLVFVVVAAGDVASFNATDYAHRLAAMLDDVAPGQIAVSVAPASVEVTASITPMSVGAEGATFAMLQAVSESTPAELSAAFGVSVEYAFPPHRAFLQALAPPPESPPPDAPSSLGAWERFTAWLPSIPPEAIAGAAGGLLVCLFTCACLCIRRRAKRRGVRAWQARARTVAVHQGSVGFEPGLDQPWDARL